MALLEQWDMSFEFVFRELDDELWIQYEFYFRWKGDSVIRDDILKRSPIGWADRSQGAFRANEYDNDSFLPVLKKVLESNQPGYWEPTESDVIIGFYPDMHFPFIPNKIRMAYESKRTNQERQDRLRRKKQNKGKLPDDTITMIAMIDAYNWKDCDAYQGQGIALVLSPKRKALEAFYDELQKEWLFFKKEQRLEERIKEREG